MSLAWFHVHTKPLLTPRFVSSRICYWWFVRTRTTGEHSCHCGLDPQSLTSWLPGWQVLRVYFLQVKNRRARFSQARLFFNTDQRLLLTDITRTQTGIHIAGHNTLADAYFVCLRRAYRAWAGRAWRYISTSDVSGFLKGQAADRFFRHE